jgi:hypothetical protein
VDLRARRVVDRGKAWLVNVGASAEVLAEDINAAVPGIRYMTELSLKPSSAPKPGGLLLQRAAKAVARGGHTAS